MRSLIEDIKTKFMKVVIFKNKFFIQNLNVKIMKVQDFNTNFLLYLRVIFKIDDNKNKICHISHYI